MKAAFSPCVSRHAMRCYWHGSGNGSLPKRREKMISSADLDMLTLNAEWPVAEEEAYLARIELEEAGELA